MRYFADLHVHSKHSRATSADCDLEHLSAWAQRKGITVVGTGDFTHPGWREELRQKLVPAEPGLFRLRPDLERAVAETVDPACRQPTRFLLSVEISTIYKKGERTRKIHHLVYAPDLAAAERLSRALARIGNLAADGRPILGLDSRHLLEIVLQAGEGCYLIPAHIWTPWFSVLGSKAGFDAVEECYGDLAGHIFALETGLSSDPPMSWQVSRLDRYRLISNSDAHSPPKLGREASRFDTDLDYFALRRALETGDGYGGTIEFFPEEGKYHLDGHRRCEVRLEPAASQALGDLCPRCGGPLTIGVLHRVAELTDRAPQRPPPSAAPFTHLVALPELLGELEETGPGSKAVQRAYHRLLQRLGPELDLLTAVPLDELSRAGSPLLAEGVARMREGKVRREAGYDGEYGVIRLFAPGELAQRRGVALLFPSAPEVPLEAASTAPDPSISSLPLFVKIDSSPQLELAAAAPQFAHREILGALDPEQREAAGAPAGPLLVVAGPGTGKTRTLTHRLAHRVAERGLPPEACLAVTFTRRAAAELRERLVQLLGAAGERIHATTFHALGLELLRAEAPCRIAGRDLPGGFTILVDPERTEAFAAALRASPRRARPLLDQLSRLRRRGEAPPPGSDLERGAAVYGDLLATRRAVDFDDLVTLAVRRIEEQPDLRAALRRRYQSISVDEFQDLDERQYRLVQLLAPPDGDLCVIGDPDQAIYSFRGADVAGFFRFPVDWPAARTVRLTRNYRSRGTIVAAAGGVIAPSPGGRGRRLEAQGEAGEPVSMHHAPTVAAEAEQVVATIERLVGGTSLFSLDSERAGGGEGGAWSFADFAVLYRTEAQAQPIALALRRSGMPYQRRSHLPLGERRAVALLVDGIRSGGGPVGAALQGAAAALREQVTAPPGDEGDDDERLTEADVDGALELLRPLAEAAAHDRGRFLTEVALAVEVDAWDPRADRISLLTLHAAKGLEFRVVFLIGCEEGLLPLAQCAADPELLDEERRLFYVGLTRARERLFLSRVKRRPRRGRAESGEPSRFLDQIPAPLCRLVSAPVLPERAASPQLDLFAPTKR